MKLNEMYDFLNEIIGLNEETLDLAFGIKGYTEDTAKDILYYITGYRDFEQYKKECYEDF